MRMYDIITKKRRGHELSDEEINFVVSGFTDGSIPDYQMSAMLMAIYFQGLNERETTTLTVAMEKSGDTVNLSRFGDKTADKHSTGGVGDKTTLIVAPIAAACGAVIAKMSGRGLGHTGGTVDKLESIEGFKTEMSTDDFLNTVKNTSLAVVGQSGNLAPADKKIYALRDVTSTVESMPLIASSIMSKKLAAGAKNIVLDVKCGSGAFMKTLDDAKALAQQMLTIGKNAGRNVRALITNMDIPLGNAVGNSLEVIEAVEVLKGKGPEDLKEVSLALASNLVAITLNVDDETAEKMTQDAILNGSALEKFREMVKAQGGNVDFIDNTDLFPKTKNKVEVVTDKNGYISHIDTEEIGNCAVMLGAGRTKKDEKIDFSSGIILLKKYGDEVREGDCIAVIYTNKDNVDDAAKRLLAAYTVSQEKPKKSQLIYEVIK